MELEPGIRAYLAKAAAVSGAGGPPRDMDERRRRMEALARAIPAPRSPALAVEDRFLPAAGREIPLRIYRPGVPGPKPLILYFHGGGWVSGSIDTHDYLASALAHEADGVVVSVHYRRAPESRHPAQVDDAYEALVWAASNPDLLGADTRRVAVVGDSAGAHLATCCAIRARDRGGPPLAFQLLIYPMVEPVFGRDSYRDFAQAPGLSTVEAVCFWEAMLGGPPADADASAVPSRQPLHDLPPTYIVTAEFDPLRDEGESYAERLIAAGVPVQLRRARGLVHGFMRAAPFSSAVRQEQDIMVDLMRRALRAEHHPA